MKRTEILQKVKLAMPEKRYIHTLGVEKQAIRLAEHYGENVEKASLAALLHDYAKYTDTKTQKDIIVQEKMDPRLLSYHPSLWHAPVGSFFAKTEFDVEDPDILEAIRVHTTGKIGMNTLDKILYLADYTEENRDFPGVEKARELVFQSLDQAMLYALGRTIIFLASKNSPIFPDTFEAYNDFSSKTIKGDVN
ncbi:bis(5'-nucleosyl)-tetraphosphatase (symmetrical) YqeK [Listeria costaricensis]|uniref:bis(5'-nucleosyl)-tetraphosphatase (symmetrical) YqeK n=1 Tax=Listeria costaricensis TaxID=2026604 RepID=UPI000C06DFEC|nr:bis(5'-nucleosyl)-tetraphosphatase (symmetrical) YqeK [Listeria costaricensis]